MRRISFAIVLAGIVRFDKYTVNQRGLFLMTTSFFPSVPALLLHRVQSTPDAEAFMFPDKNDIWQSRSWKEFGDEVKLVAGGLRSLGIGLEERCSILCNTRYDWVVIDLGINCAGGATTTIYPSSNAEGCAYIINNSETQFLFAEDQDQVDKIIGVRDSLP